MTQSNKFDAYSPAEIADRVDNAGIAKTALPTVPLLVLAVLAGAFISFGAMLYGVVITESGLGFGPERLIGGLAFSLGLILVIVGGAELFTGNNLILFAWADRKIAGAGWLAGSESVTAMGYGLNLLIVTIGNIIGGGVLVSLVYWLVYGKASSLR